MHAEPGFTRFWILLLASLGGLGLVAVAGDLVLLLAGWELVGLATALLVAFFHERTAPVRSALFVLGHYRIADMGLVVAVAALHLGTGETSFDAMLGPSGLGGAAELAIVLGLVVAAAGKSALLPFSAWLPRAMEGPTPTSAIFYAGLSLHAGVVLLLRVEPLVARHPAVAWSLCGLGLLTALVAGAHARVAPDLKGRVAHDALAHVGIVVMEIGLGWSTLALWHALGNIALRLREFLRSPSAIHDAHAHESRVGHPIAAGPSWVARWFGPAVETWLWGRALGRFGLDATVEQLVIRPVEQLAIAGDAFERAVFGLERPATRRPESSAQPSEAQP